MNEKSKKLAEQLLKSMLLEQVNKERAKAGLGPISQLSATYWKTFGAPQIALFERHIADYNPFLATGFE